MTAYCLAGGRLRQAGAADALQEGMQFYHLTADGRITAPPAAPACLQPGQRGARSCDFCFDYSSKRGIRKGILFLS